MSAQQHVAHTQPQAHFADVARAVQPARRMPRRINASQGTPQGTLAVNNVRAKKQTNNENQLKRAAESSATGRSRTRQGHTIGQNIIGRTMSVGAGQLGIHRLFHGEHGAFALLDQPARQHGGSAFFQVLVDANWRRVRAGKARTTAAWCAKRTAKIPREPGRDAETRALPQRRSK
jgi:hypothetical protein